VVIEKTNLVIFCMVHWSVNKKWMCKNAVERSRPEMTIWRMRIACWITKATYTHWECVMFIAFPLQQWSQERASLLPYSTMPSCYIISPSEWRSPWPLMRSTSLAHIILHSVIALKVFCEQYILRSPSLHSFLILQPLSPPPPPQYNIPLKILFLKALSLYWNSSLAIFITTAQSVLLLAWYRDYTGYWGLVYSGKWGMSTEF
jgi:hypothetical protein